jgi:hypothetical protein
MKKDIKFRLGNTYTADFCGITVQGVLTYFNHKDSVYMLRITCPFENTTKQIQFLYSDFI